MVNGKLPQISKLLGGSIICLTLCTLGIYYVQHSYRSSFEQETIDWKVIAGELSDGDLVFRTGRDMISHLVLSQGDLPRFSHVGIILRNQSELVVVHAVPQNGKSAGGVIVEPLDTFTAKDNAKDVGFYRAKKINDKARRIIREYSLQQVGKGFDYRFLWNNDDELYCTELVLKAFTKSGITLTASLPKVRVMLVPEPVYPPDHLSKSSQLESIFY